MDLPQLLRILAGVFFALTFLYSGYIVWRGRVAPRKPQPARAYVAAEDLPEAPDDGSFPEAPLENEYAGDAFPAAPGDLGLESEPFATAGVQESPYYEGGMPEGPAFDFGAGSAAPNMPDMTPFEIDEDGAAAGAMPTAGPAAGAPQAGPDTVPPAIMEWVISADRYEGYPPGHARRIADTAKMLGKDFMLEPGELSLLEAAALLHDVGEVNHDDYIHEPRPLSDEEWLNLRQHPLRSEQTILQLPNLEKAAQWVRHHHERWDGRGYPDRLKGEKIPLPARILAVADAWEALTHDRPHRRALPELDAKEELRRLAGTQFDAAVVKALLPRVGPGLDEEIVMRIKKRLAKEGLRTKD